MDGSVAVALSSLGLLLGHRSVESLLSMRPDSEVTEPIVVMCGLVIVVVVGDVSWSDKFAGWIVVLLQGGLCNFWCGWVR